MFRVTLFLIDKNNSEVLNRWMVKQTVECCCCCCCSVASFVSDSVRPHRRQPTRLPCPWDSPGKNTGMGCHFLLQCKKVKSESEVAQLLLNNKRNELLTHATTLIKLQRISLSHKKSTPKSYILFDFVYIT